jgi:hypothetical protein
MMRNASLLLAGGDMKMNTNRPDTWYPWRAMRRRGVQCIMGGIFAPLFCVLFSSPVHAIGPYTAASNTVIDQGTGLEWQKSDDGTLRNWQNGLAYCEELSLNAKTDWRLPNIRELKSIVDISRYHPATDPVFSARFSSYWSATTVATVTNQPATSAWIVNFANGDDNWYVKTDSYLVRCVRGGI